MGDFWWQLPGLRGLSHLRRGFAEAIVAKVVATLLVLPFVLMAKPTVPAGAFDSAAQIGATLLVAYAVEISWWLKSSRIRNIKRENWVGYSAGIAMCSLLGVFVALVLSTKGGELNGIESLGLAWSFLTLAVLGGLVATLPLLIYEWAHQLQAEYPDE